MLSNVQPPKNMRLIDTNIILRFILNDNPEMAKCAKETIEAGAYTKPEIIAEVVYVLKSVYAVRRERIGSIIQNISKIIHLENGPRILYAAELYSATSLDFVDCLLAAYHTINHETVVTFDKKLKKRLMAE